MNDAELQQRIGAAFVSFGFLDEERHGVVERLMQEQGISFERALYQVDPSGSRHLKVVLEDVTGVPSVDPSLMHLTDEFLEMALDLVDPRVLVITRAFPVQLQGNRMHVAMVNPTEEGQLRALEGLVGLEVVPNAVPELALVDTLEEHCADAIREIRATGEADLHAACEALLQESMAREMDAFIDPALRTFARQQELKVRDPEAALRAAVNHPTNVRLVHQILNRLVHDEASDIHIEPQEDHLRLRGRVDGVMSTYWRWPRLAIEPILARIKTMAGLDPRPTRDPLDGNISYGVIFGRDVEFRVSVLPALHGEKAVLRVLDRSGGLVDLGKLGFDDDYDTVVRHFSSPDGLVLVTGPTGSGKTTTLYAALDLVNTDEVTTVTAEDPVESNVAGATQVNCTEGGLGFAEALRSFLRQDPDIIMVGEIRDEETANIALRAALTGHLVLSTLHTNDAAATIMRLTNMGLEPFLIAAALRMVVAQRLVRTLCPDCRRQEAVDDLHRNAFEAHDIEAPDSVYLPEGCAACKETGYRGRTGLYEVLVVDDELEALIGSGAGPAELRAASRQRGCRSIFQAGLSKVAAGITSLAEVERVSADAG